MILQNVLYISSLKTALLVPLREEEEEEIAPELKGRAKLWLKSKL